MAKLKKENQDAEKKFEVLIENYNTKDKVREIGRQEKLSLNIKEIEELLGIMETKKALSKDVGLYNKYWDDYLEGPVTDTILDLFEEMEEIKDSGFHPRILTKDFIIWREDKEECACLKNYFRAFFFKIPFCKKDFFNLNEVKDFFTKQEKRRFLFTILNLIIPFILPSLLIFLLLCAFDFYINQYGSNLFFMIFWYWLIFLALVNLAYSLIFHYKKGKIEYHTPLLIQFKPYNLSSPIILFVLCIGLLYFGILFLALGFTGVDITGLIFVGPIPETVEIFGFTIPGEWIKIAIIIILIVILIYVIVSLIGYGFPVITAPFQMVYTYYKLTKGKKLYILHYLNKYLQKEDLDLKEKSLFHQLLIEIDKTPITTVDVFTKLIALLTFLISIIPPYLIPLFQ